MSRTYTRWKRRSSQTHARRGHECEFCDAVSHGNGGKVAHARAHVRRGEAVELVMDMPYPFGPSRFFLACGDVERIAEWTARGYAVAGPRPPAQESSP